MDSILLSIRKLIGGLDEAQTPFDPDLIIFINATFTILAQLGVGPAEPFKIEDASTTWDEFECGNLEAVKEYIYLKVKLVFDPPANSSVMEAYRARANELEWRMNVISEEANGKI